MVSSSRIPITQTSAWTDRGRDMARISRSEFITWLGSHTYQIPNPKVGDKVFVVVETSSDCTIVEGVIDKVTPKTVHVENALEYKTFYKHWYQNYCAVRKCWVHVDLYIEG